MTAARLITIAGIALATACSRQTASEQDKREQDFIKTMSGVTLAGKFSSTGNDRIHEDRYTISKVSKVGGDVWLVHSRIQYGKRDVTVPVPVKVLWAGDTPVLTLTDAGIPGLGTFTARVLIYRDQYAGTWSSSKGHGGQMFGRLERSGGAK